MAQTPERLRYALRVTDPQPPAPRLDGTQKRYLRGLAQRLKPTVWVGDAGVTPGVLASLEDALEAHELVKVRLRAPEDKKAAAGELAEAARAALCGLIGHTVILYRPRSEDPEISLPR